MNSSRKQDAVLEVVEMMERHRLTLEDIAAALQNPVALKTKKSTGILSRLFGYVGGIFVFVGLAIYVGMQWDHLDSAGRILVTLGPGFCAFILALVCTTDARFERAATPLFLVAAFMEPSGILVMMKEYSRGGDPAHGLLFMHLVMGIQQGCAFKAKDRTVLAFTTLVFCSGFFVIACDLLGINDRLIGFTLGFSWLCIAWSLGQSRHRPIAALGYFFGAILVLGVSYDWLRNTPAEILFLGLSCLVIYVSTLARSRSLLLVGTLAMIGYIGHYIAMHFANNLNAPVLLMLMGFILIGMGAIAVQINNKYIKSK